MSWSIQQPAITSRLSVHTLFSATLMAACCLAATEPKPELDHDQTGGLLDAPPDLLPGQSALCAMDRNLLFGSSHIERAQEICLNDNFPCVGKFQHPSPCITVTMDELLSPSPRTCLGIVSLRIASPLLYSIRPVEKANLIVARWRLLRACFALGLPGCLPGTYR